MLKALIIDDEKEAQEALAILVRETLRDSVEICACCGSAEEGRRAVLKYSPDLIFLDIDMPFESGFDFIESIKNINFEIIFVTAHNEYALKAFQYHAANYLLKPINPEALIKAIHSLEQRLIGGLSERNDSKNIVEQVTKYLTLKTLGIATSEGVIFIECERIIRCEGSSNYTKIYMENDKKFLAARTLKDFEEILSNHNFMRVHKSHLINLKKLKSYKRSASIILLLDGTEVPLSRTLKEDFEKRIVVM